jgi:hypothetical protein
MLSGEHPRTVRSCFAFRRDVPAEVLLGDPPLLAELLRDFEFSPVAVMR